MRSTDTIFLSHENLNKNYHQPINHVQLQWPAVSALLFVVVFSCILYVYNIAVSAT